IKTQSEGVAAILRSPMTAVHVVTLLEEMPVQETADAIAELDALKISIGRIVVNAVQPQLLAAGKVTQAELRRGLVTAGLPAERHGRRTVVLTIDPARRLAQALGLSELDNTPRPVKGTNGDAGGELHAMMLDMKRTFDEVVLTHTDPKRAEDIFANPFYQAMS